MGHNGKLGMEGNLRPRVMRSPRTHRVRQLRLPGGLGRIMLTRDCGDSVMTAREYFQTNLTARKFDGDGQLVHEYDLGSGLVTNVGVLAMANDFAWAAPSGASQATLALSNYHSVGTGATAAAATDVQMQTLAAPTTTTAVTGTQSLVSAANSQTYRTVATVSFTSTLAITEWGLHNDATLSASTGTPFTATSATSATATATPWTASSTTVRGTPQARLLRPGTTTVWGLVTSNTTSVATIPAWYTVAAGTAGSTPGSTEAFTIQPVLWDRKVFSAINVVNGDSIQFTYSLLINSGG
jgi:hypothetical protein